MSGLNLAMNIVFAAAVVAMIAVPLYLVLARWLTGQVRLQFSIGDLFGVLTILAIVFAIIRIDVPWPLKVGLIWAILVCAVGWPTRWRIPRASSGSLKSDSSDSDR